MWEKINKIRRKNRRYRGFKHVIWKYLRIFKKNNPYVIDFSEKNNHLLKSSSVSSKTTNKLFLISAMARKILRTRKANINRKMSNQNPKKKARRQRKKKLPDSLILHKRRLERNKSRKIWKKCVQKNSEKIQIIQN